MGNRMTSQGQGSFPNEPDLFPQPHLPTPSHTKLHPLPRRRQAFATCPLRPCSKVTSSTKTSWDPDRVHLSVSPGQGLAECCARTGKCYERSAEPGLTRLAALFPAARGRFRNTAWLLAWNPNVAASCSDGSPLKCLLGSNPGSAAYLSRNSGASESRFYFYIRSSGGLNRSFPIKLLEQCPLGRSQYILGVAALRVSAGNRQQIQTE